MMIVDPQKPQQDDISVPLISGTFYFGEKYLLSHQ